MKPSNRREFLKRSTAAGVGLTTAGFSPRRIFARESSGFHRVVYRDLGSTGYKTTEIGLGSARIKDAALIEAAIDAGINYIDTSHIYMKGASEEAIGQVMKTKRDKVFLATKIRVLEGLEIEKMGKGYFSIKNAPQKIETSLKRLQTDHVDLLLLHLGSLLGIGQNISDEHNLEQVLSDDVLEIFDNARKKGQTRFVGVATHHVEVLDAISDSKFWDAALVTYNYFSSPEVFEAIKKTREAGIAVIGMKNLLNIHTRPWDKFKDIREDKTSKITPEQALIKFALENKYIDTTLLGISSFEELEDDLAIMGTKLTFDDRRLLRRYSERLKGYYCCGLSGCTGCRGKCPKGVEVNEINRCLGYAYGYDDIELAQENYQNLQSSNHVGMCADCDECMVKCVNGLNLTENIQKARILFT
ncbi:MAG: twin-arginine translocation signal domain-containing protein [Candidatus Latescibacteria bacterium]|nr:twin-arginine translocation signal domain-containing protein [Candidatus Latescibacterota bacterium]